MTGFMFAPRWRLGPLPSFRSPSFFLSVSGWSEAKLTSIAMPASGLTLKDDVIAPRSPISSWTVATPTTQILSLRFDSARITSATMNAPALSSMARETMRSSVTFRYWTSMTIGSPIATLLRAAFFESAPMSTQMLSILTALFRSSGVIWWIAFLPMTPSTGPFSVMILTRCPMRRAGSIPPIWAV